MSTYGLAKSDIDVSDDPYGTVMDYVNDFHITNGDTAVSSLPVGLQQMLLIVDLDSEYHNGRLSQYFGNRTDEQDVVHDAVYFVPSALDKMGTSGLAELMRRATTCWRGLIDETPYKEWLRLDKNIQKKWIEMIDEELRIFDEQFASIYDESVAGIASYIRSHPDEFCHEGAKGDKSDDTKLGRD